VGGLTAGFLSLSKYDIPTNIYEAPTANSEDLLINVELRTIARLNQESF